MKRAFNWLTSNRNLAIFVIAFQALAFFFVAWKAHWSWGWAVFAMDVAAIVGLACRQRWAIVLGTGLIAWSAISMTMGLFTKGWSTSRALQAVGLSAIGWGLIRAPYSGLLDGPEDVQKEDEDDNRTLISLVHLRRSQRYLEPVILAQALSDAWDLSITASDDEAAVEAADGFVVGTDSMYFVWVTKPRSTAFIIHNREGSYWNDSEGLATKVPNLRFAEIIREHSGWLAVDLLDKASATTDPDDAYRMIGKAIAALADSDTLALVCPQKQYFNLWSEGLSGLLCGEEPLSVFREEVKAPVISVKSDETMEECIAEARRRWPEFVEAFKHRTPDGPPFIVKAPIHHDGDVEHIWLKVFGLEPEYIHGNLCNEPFHHPTLKKGSQVEIPVAEITDWICVSGGEPLGNFTGALVSNAQHGDSKRT